MSLIYEINNDEKRTIYVPHIRLICDSIKGDSEFTFTNSMFLNKNIIVYIESLNIDNPFITHSIDSIDYCSFYIKVSRTGLYIYNSITTTLMLTAAIPDIFRINIYIDNYNHDDFFKDIETQKRRIIYLESNYEAFKASMCLTSGNEKKRQAAEKAYRGVIEELCAARDEIGKLNLKIFELQRSYKKRDKGDNH